jgi:hypothetical protein
MMLAVRETSEVAARVELRRQIAFLEARGGRAPATDAGPRLLSLGELEAVRDAMTARTSIPSRYDGMKRTFEAMVRDPGAHRGVAISLRELGRPGCGVYRVKPRLGIIGMLAGWWQITLSSGCP